MIIESKDNKHFKEFKKLTTVEGVRKYGRVIVSGKKLVREIAQSQEHRCIALITYERYADDDSEIKTIIQSFVEAGSFYTLKKHLYNELDTFNTTSPLLIIQTPEIPEWDYSLAEGCNLLIPFQDPVNVGAVIRSAAGFGVNKIIILKEAAHPFHPKSIKSSAGAVLKANLLKGPLINDLEDISSKRSLKIVSLDMDGKPIESFEFPQKFLLLPGLEGQGIPFGLQHNSVSIPISSTVESLNAAIATSIALFCFRNK